MKPFVIVKLGPVEREVGLVHVEKAGAAFHDDISDPSAALLDHEIMNAAEVLAASLIDGSYPVRGNQVALILRPVETRRLPAMVAVSLGVRLESAIER